MISVNCNVLCGKNCHSALDATVTKSTASCVLPLPYSFTAYADSRLIRVINA